MHMLGRQYKYEFEPELKTMKCGFVNTTAAGFIKILRLVLQVNHLFSFFYSRPIITILNQIHKKLDWCNLNL